MKTNYLKLLLTAIILLFSFDVNAQDGTINGHEYVDLALPSGTLWATCNIGASKPEEYGLYFAWGETTGYTSDTNDGHVFNWNNYKWCNGTFSYVTKYCTFDKKYELESADDAATVAWGSEWQMPSFAQIKELYDSRYTTTEWKRVNGVLGRKITSKKNNNSIFLPAAGYRRNAILYFACSITSSGSSGDYWSRSLYTDDIYGPSGVLFAYTLTCRKEYIDQSSMERCDGISVRPVCNQSTAIKTINVENFRTNKRIHSINGIETDKLTQGINIIEYSDGTRIKVVK